MTGFEKSEVWKAGCRLAVDIYAKLNSGVDRSLGDQIKRAAVSIPSNIAEGSERQSKKEFVQFRHIAKGSCAELRTQLYIARSIGAISPEDMSLLTGEATRISAMLNSLIAAVKSSPPKPLNP